MNNVVSTNGYNYPIVNLPGSISASSSNIGSIEDYNNIVNLADKTGMICIISGGVKSFLNVTSISSRINAYRISYSADSTTILFAGFNTNDGVLNYTASVRSIPLNVSRDAIGDD